MPVASTAANVTYVVETGNPSEDAEAMTLAETDMITPARRLSKCTRLPWDESLGAWEPARGPYRENAAVAWAKSHAPVWRPEPDLIAHTPGGQLPRS